jgi:hypothetical protein
MTYRKGAAADVLTSFDFGASVAEQDELLEAARVETSVFTDLFLDRVDLVPGTKGSGKSALYRIFVDFLAPALLASRKVVVAHGVQSHGDSVFMAFNDEFEKLSEDEFVDFWCIYLISLAHEQFVKAGTYREQLVGCDIEIERFRRACEKARIPEIAAPKSLKDILEWALNALRGWHPRAAVTVPDGTKLELELFKDPELQRPPTSTSGREPLPRFVGEVEEALEAILTKSDLSLWLMIDRLDEIFPRRSQVETRALRGLLRTLRIFESSRVRVKVFLRDDVLEQVTTGGQGFTALTHITARQADTLKWSIDGILTLVTKRLFASRVLCDFVDVDPDRLSASSDARLEAFYRVFPRTVYSPPNQSETLQWIYTHTMDGRRVVTPRDVIDLLTKAKQRQQDEYQSDPDGDTDSIIGSAAIRYGLGELSARKRDTYLRAELPHLWPDIDKFRGQKTEWTEASLAALLGKRWKVIVADLVSIGFLSPGTTAGQRTYKVPFVYRDGLELTQGRMP